MNEIDPEIFELNSKADIIANYVKSVQQLKKFVQNKYDVSSIEFDDYLYQQFFNKYKMQISQSHRIARKGGFRSYGEFVATSIWANKRQYCYFIIGVTLIILLVNYQAEASHFFMRHIQTMIYPGMRAWRILTLPIIETFPWLTQLYDETCLVSNPLFQVANLDCKPCSSVVSVLDLTSSSFMGQYLDGSAPYFVKANHTLISIPMLYELYNEHRAIFRENAYKITSSQSHIMNLDDLFSHFLNENATTNVRSHNLWRINRMAPVRILRELFSKPPGLPETAGIGVERYIAIDSVNGPSYALPATDCSNMYVYMAQGARTIHLRPTSECQTKCRQLHIRLEEASFLFYDWWYWKPVSVADPNTKVSSITYVGSYC